MANYLSAQDYQDYGPDLVNFAQRAAADAMAPQIQHLDQQNQELRQRLAVEARARMDMAVEAAIPNWRTLDQHPDWHTWLLGVDSLSGRVRQTLLNEAKASGDAARCIAFFRSFFSRAQPHSAASRGGSSPSGRATYTRPQIQALYAAHRKGAYAGREQEWNRIELDIIAAGREGRVLNPDRITK